MQRWIRPGLSPLIVAASLALGHDAFAAPCNGDRGSGASSACPNASAPFCFEALDGGADAGDAGGDAGATGSCGQCTSSAQCGVGHTGPTCDLVAGACTDIDSDGDLVNDSVEALLGTNPHNSDSDGDMISDGVELRPNGGGATAKIDTDGDGIIDALDTDSDGDGVPDLKESTDEIDGDGIGNWRDTDDDGDTILTAVEIADATAAATLNGLNNGVTDPSDCDGDGKPNYYDTDADDDSKPDMVEGRGDSDCDGILNYLDAKDTQPEKCTDAAATKPDAGDPGASGGFDAGDLDAGTPPQAAPDLGVLEGSGLLCSTTHGSGSGLALFAMLGIGVMAILRRRR